jgi:mono/diheme cytochrome c family protein
LAGCTEDGYSPTMHFPPRTDPIVTKAITKESKFPDQPGQLPVMTFARLEDPTYILHELQGNSLNPSKLTRDDRAVLERKLMEMFGTPAAPTIKGPNAEQLISELKLDEKTLVEGSRHYRHHCLHCHGLTGDGRGPTSFWINPHPRDYRKGMYKFVSTNVMQGGEQRARREDLRRTVAQGLEGTAMPAFNVLTDQEIEAIVSYVIYLGLRGEVEENSIADLLRAPGGGGEWDPAERIESGLTVFGGRWLKSNAPNAIVVPDEYPYKEEDFAASVARGWEIFKTAGDKGGGDCLKCHTDYGRKSMYRFDDWGTMVRPADLTAGMYRGGRRPVDLYWRIYSGISGSGMVRSPQFTWAEDKKAKEAGTNRLWDLVNFLQVLPYQQMRQKYGIQIN